MINKYNKEPKRTPTKDINSELKMSTLLIKLLLKPRTLNMLNCFLFRTINKDISDIEEAEAIKITIYPNEEYSNFSVFIAFRNS